MEEDVEMQNGYESYYPNPYANSPTPYPMLSHANGTTSHSPPATNGNGIASITTPPRIEGPTFTTLADYFSIGNITNNRLRLSVEPEQDAQSDADDDEGPIERTETRQQATLNGAVTESADDSDGYDSSTNQTPWTSNFFVRYGSGSPQPERAALPGFHALPEVDIYYTPSQSSQTKAFPGSVQRSRYESASSQPSTPQPRGRGQTPRGSRRGRPRGSRGGWKNLIKNTDHAKLFEKPRLPRDPTTGGRGRRRGRKIKKPTDPGPEYKEAAAAANQAFFAEDFDSALEHVFKAIQINPEIYHAHLLMSEILEKQGHSRDALYAITNGAVAKRDAKVFVEVAERYLAFYDAEQNRDDLNSAKRCYMEAVKLDKENSEMREGKLKLLLELEEWDAARLECKGLVRLCPAELDYVRQYASLCNMTGKDSDRMRAEEAYGTAFELLEGQSSLDQPEQHWDHLNVYLDLLLRGNSPEYALRKAKKISRWFLGRKDDIFWDAFTTDDREFDVDDSRRAQNMHWQRGMVSRNPSHYGGGLPLDIRVKMGMCRARMGLLHQPEALKHLSHLRQLSAEVEDYSDMFFDVAECLRKSNFPETAITFYEPMKDLPGLPDEHFWVGLAQSYDRVGRLEDAEESYLKAAELSPNWVDIYEALLRIYKAKDQKVQQAAMARELIRLKKERIVIRNQIALPLQKPPGRQKGLGNASHPSKKKRLLAPKARSIRQNGKDPNDDAMQEAEAGDEEMQPDSNQTQRLRRRKVRVRTNYEKLKELWAGLESRQNAEATQQWIQHASALAKIFREVKEFFPSHANHTHDKYFTHIRDGIKMQGSKRMKDLMALKHQLQNSVSNGEEAMAMLSLESGAVDDFEEITFAEWHRILSTLAIAYAEIVAQDKCYDILQNILMRANIFKHNAEHNNTTLAAVICCALKFNDSRLMTETVRQWNFPGIHSSTQTSQLVAVSGSLSHGDSNFYNRNTQSWAQFAVKEQDFRAMAPEMRNSVDWGDDAHRLHDRAERNNNGNGIDDLDPGLLATYAHILGSRQGHAVKHTSSGLALSYLFRALALQPDNTVINLSIAIMYLSICTREKAENRQYAMAQGLAFLYRYQDLRIASNTASHVQEAEFNMGRTWHLLGRPYLAVPAYEKVLRLSAQVQEEVTDEVRAEGQVEDFAPEAALALRSIYIASGNEDAARSLTEKWLVL